jgi:RNA-directed DNA polymerase
MRKRSLLNALATVFLAGEQTSPAVIARASCMLGREWPWLRPLARRYVKHATPAPAPSHLDVVRFIAKSRFFVFAYEKFGADLFVRSWIATPQASAAVSSWHLPKIDDVAALGRWLAVDFAHLEWFADRKHLGYKTNQPKMEHYNYRVLAKPNGSIRLIEAPKKTLKELQRRILWEILDRVPAHPAVHGFVAGRSIKSFVVPHVCKRVVLRMDLKDFFPGIRAARVAALFRTFGYPEPVADSLAGICTNAVPRRLWNGTELDAAALYELHSLYRRPHLPQGAPTSPALANLSAYRMDCRLNAIAKKVGAVYSRYADDLGFSGDAQFERSADRFSVRVAAIAMEEGFAVNHRKTRLMRRGVRQHLAGLTANQHLNISREEFDRLKATLTNCVRHGPTSQNREGHSAFREHLAGRIGFVASVNPQKGTRLREIFDRVHWE